MDKESNSCDVIGNQTVADIQVSNISSSPEKQRKERKLLAHITNSGRTVANNTASSLLRPEDVGLSRAGLRLMELGSHCGSEPPSVQTITDLNDSDFSTCSRSQAEAEDCGERLTSFFSQSRNDRLLVRLTLNKATTAFFENILNRGSKLGFESRLNATVNAELTYDRKKGQNSAVALSVFPSSLPASDSPPSCDHLVRHFLKKPFLPLANLFKKCFSIYRRGSDNIEEEVRS